MFGILRRYRKRKLKRQLLKEGQLDAYLRRFHSRIQDMEKKRQKYIDMAFLGKSKNDEGQMKLGIQYTEYLDGILTKMRELKLRLETATLSIDSQDAYNDMVLAINEFTGEMRDGSIKKRKQRRILRRWRKETRLLSSQIRMVDSRLDKIDNNMEKILQDKQGYSEVNVDEFFAKHQK